MLFSWIIIVFLLVEFMTSSRFVGAVSTSAVAASVSSWVGTSSKLCVVKVGPVARQVVEVREG